MQDFKQGWGEQKRRRHLLAIRRNQLSVSAMIQFLHEQPPNASAAKEALDELDHDDAIAIWSCSTTDGGIWETWQRDALKYGDIDTTKSFTTWNNKHGNST